MKKILIALGLCAALGVQAAIINSSFETGSYSTDWTRYRNWSGGYPNGSPVVTGTPLPNTVVVTSDGSLTPFYGLSTYYNPDSGGDYFVKITTTSANQHQGIFQSFYWSGGNPIYGWFTAASGAPTIMD
ncbi:hypothetical protein NXS98_11930 [Fontisphaera persica]|uniref:hypothetical protein n=1 Tax=Fontisphaera persica TaxID=2974023 RepID=UPI0024C08FC4|nr:hypothetical protein [Fontisphaera persica]WCJ58430.1 hypothetical protein NXS98_11930 [Fontisphaera persica]